jgi:hypothetical protein
MHVLLSVILNVDLCFILMTTETNEERIVSKFILFIMAPRMYLAAVKQVHETAYSSLFSLLSSRVMHCDLFQFRNTSKIMNQFEKNLAL